MIHPSTPGAGDREGGDGPSASLRGAARRLVNIESPFAGGGEEALRYARACMRDSISLGEAPIASHLLYTQPGILDDEDYEERELGIRCGFAWNEMAAATVVYTDLGISHGMRMGILEASERGRPVEYRTLPGWEPMAPQAPRSAERAKGPLPATPEVTP